MRDHAAGGARLTQLSRDSAGPGVGAGVGAGVWGVHVRTRLRCDEDALRLLLASAPDVVSVDLVSDDALTYARLEGVDGHALAQANLQKLLERRAPGTHGPSRAWVVPRLTRRDAVHDEVEAFALRWTMLAGHALLDPLPGPDDLPGARIAPLPWPATYRARAGRTTLRIDADGRATLLHPPGVAARGVDVSRITLAQAWRTLMAEDAARGGGAGSASGPHVETKHAPAARLAG